MATQYETTFTIAGDGQSAGVTLLREARELITDELLSAVNETTPDVEADATEDDGYSQISAERQYPGTDYTIRLEVRLCTDGSDVKAQVRTRFISATGGDPSGLRAGPPRLLSTITERFACRGGIVPIGSEAVRVTDANVREFTEHYVLSPEQTMPILAISEDSAGRTALDPDTAQRVLAGIALVARYNVAAADITRGHLGYNLACYNGAIRIWWPGCQIGCNGPGPGVFYMYQAAANAGSDLLNDLQEKCLASRVDDEFDGVFSRARTEVVLERNRALAVAVERVQQHIVEPATLGPELEQSRKDLRREQLGRAEANRKLSNAQATIDNLRQELSDEKERAELLIDQPLSAPDEAEGSVEGQRERNRRLRNANAGLRQTNEVQSKTINRLNDDNQSLRQELAIRKAVESGFCEIRITGRHPDYVTVLNHAINLYRDPMRRFIVASLQKIHGDDLKDVFSRSIEFNGSENRDVAHHPEAVIDVADFESLISDNSECFDSGRTLAHHLREIRYIRNRAAHPPPGGLSAEYAQDSLRTITDALQMIRALPERTEIADYIGKIAEHSG